MSSHLTLGMVEDVALSPTQHAVSPTQHADAAINTTPMIENDINVGGKQVENKRVSCKDFLVNHKQ